MLLLSLLIGYPSTSSNHPLSRSWSSTPRGRPRTQIQMAVLLATESVLLAPPADSDPSPVSSDEEGVDRVADNMLDSNSEGQVSSDSSVWWPPRPVRTRGQLADLGQTQWRRIGKRRRIDAEANSKPTSDWEDVDSPPSHATSSLPRPCSPRRRWTSVTTVSGTYYI
jgi:hypothetical protein